MALRDIEEMLVEKHMGACLPEIEHGSHICLSGNELYIYTPNHRWEDWILVDESSSLSLQLEGSLTTPTEAELMEWVVDLLERQGLYEFYPELRTGLGRVDLLTY